MNVWQRVAKQPWKTTALAVLASPWFFLVSCSASLETGMHVIARMDARDEAKGQRVHDFFSVAVEPGDDGRPFKVVDLSAADRVDPSSGTFLMSKPEGRIDLNENWRQSYRVLEDQGLSQIIEVEDWTDDGTLWSRYRATKTGVAPLSSRMWHHAYMFGAFPFAFLFALALYLGGVFLKRRNERA